MYLSLVEIQCAKHTVTNQNVIHICACFVIVLCFVIIAAWKCNQYSFLYFTVQFAIIVTFLCQVLLYSVAFNYEIHIIYFWFVTHIHNYMFLCCSNDCHSCICLNLNVAFLNKYCVIVKSMNPEPPSPSIRIDFTAWNKWFHIKHMVQ